MPIMPSPDVQMKCLMLSPAGESSRKQKERERLQAQSRLAPEMVRLGKCMTVRCCESRVPSTSRNNSKGPWDNSVGKGVGPQA